MWIEWNELWSGVEWSRVEWRSGKGCRMSGVEWSGVEWSPGHRRRLAV